MRGAQRRFAPERKDMKKIILVVVILALVLTACGFAYGYFSQREEVKGLSTALEGAKADIEGMKTPDVGTTKNGVVYLSQDAKVYSSFDSAFTDKDSSGTLVDYISEISEKGLLVLLKGNTIGTMYNAEATKKSANGETSLTVYVVSGLYIVQPDVTTT